MKRVFITGATGFVGSHMLTYFSNKAGYEVFGTSYGGKVDVLGSIKPENLKHLNLLDRDSVFEVVGEIQPDYVIHLAAISSPKQSFESPNETLVNNISAQVYLFEALSMLNHKPEKILIIGSAEEYGLVRETDCPINESVPLNPTSPYAVSKIAQDYLGLQYYLSHKLPIVRLRPFNHTGERQPDAFVLPAFCKRVAEIEAGEGEQVLKLGNLNPVRDFTDVKDMVRAYELALLKARAGEVYNIGSGRGITIQALLDMILAETKAEITIEVDKKMIKPADVPVLIADSSKFMRETGWRVEIPIEETVKRVLDYWRMEVNKQKEYIKH